MNLQEVGCLNMDWIDLSKLRRVSGHFWKWKWTFGFHKMRRISWPSENRLASQEGVCSMEKEIKLLPNYAGSSQYSESCERLAANKSSRDMSFRDGVVWSICFLVISRIVTGWRTFFVFSVFLQVFRKDPCTHVGFRRPCTLDWFRTHTA